MVKILEINFKTKFENNNNISNKYILDIRSTQESNTKYKYLYTITFNIVSILVILQFH